jgi:hypothetical protein
MRQIVFILVMTINFCAYAATPQKDTTALALIDDCQALALMGDINADLQQYEYSSH